MTPHLTSTDGAAVPNRTQYPQDSVLAKRPSFVYAGKVRTIENSSVSGHSIREIDGAVIVRSIDERTRLEAMHTFANVKQDAVREREVHQAISRRNIVEIGVGIGATAIGFTISAATFFVVPALIGGIAGTILAVDGIRRYVGSSSVVDAVDEDIAKLKGMENTWQDPLPRIIEQRKLAGTLGFDYVIRNDLKGTVVHAEETKQLWTDAFQRLVQSHSDIDRVYSEDLLGERAVAYAFSSPFIPNMSTQAGYFTAGRMGAIAEQYRQWRDACKAAEANQHAALSNLWNKKRMLEGELSTMRQRWLLPADRTYHLGRENAEHHYRASLAPYILERDKAISDARRVYDYSVIDPFDPDEVAHKAHLNRMLDETISTIRHTYKNHPDILEIKATYSYDMRMHEFMYQQSKGLVSSYFDSKIRQLNQEAGIAESQIISQYQASKGQLRELLHRILDPKEQAFAIRDFMVAPIMETWRFSDFTNEPSWNLIYGNRPQFQPGYTSSVLLDDWDMFWGDRGLGAFASRPVNHWNTVTREHIFTRRYPVRRSPPAGIFRQPVVVPTFTRRDVVRVVPGQGAQTVVETRRVIPGTTTVRPAPVVTPAPVHHVPPVVEGTRVVPGHAAVRPAPVVTPVPVHHVPPVATPAPVHPIQPVKEKTRVVPGHAAVRPARAVNPAPVHHVQPVEKKTRVAPGNRTSHGAAQRREQPAPVKTQPAQGPRVVPGMRQANGFGRTSRR